MANVQRRGDGYWVRWKELHVIKNPDGTKKRVWKERSRTFPSREAAEQHARDVETLAAKGERWADERETATATIGAVADAYCDAAQNDRTRKWRKSMIKPVNGVKIADVVRDDEGNLVRAAEYSPGFVAFMGRDRPVVDLSIRLLEQWAATLPSSGREASTKHRRVLAVEDMWAWAYEPRNRERFPGVPEPMRLTGTDVNAPVQPAEPVIRTAAPTVADVDSMIGALRTGYTHGDAHRKVALLCRYTGIRIAQAVNLDWRDVRLEHPAGPHVILRSGRRGAKKGRTRVVPLHPALAEEMGGWGKREGRVFPSTNERWTRGEATREAMRTAWSAAGVAREKWDRPDVGEGEEGERGHGSPTHAIRAGVFTALLREGVSMDVASYLIGHATTATQAAYVPEAAPETSPLWPRLVAAAKLIPDHRGNNVRQFAANR
jgi:integrase